MRSTAYSRVPKRPSKKSLAEIPELDLMKATFLGRGLRRNRRLPLRALRQRTGKTQADVARATQMAQSEISRIEQRDDILLSTLRLYARALGADLELVAVFPTGHRVRLEI